MRAVRVHAYHEDPRIDDIDEPKLSGPLDVIVKIGGAGVCRTDLHILEGQWAEVQNPQLPYVIGHENAGWVHEVGDGVTNVAVGDTVILHPQPSCGLCRACRAGNDMQCENAFFPGLSNNDGGMAEYLRTTARACVKLDPSTNPADVAALADAGITAYHAVRKALPLLPRDDGRRAGRRRAGPHRHPVPRSAHRDADRRRRQEPDALKLAGEIGADQTVLADGDHVGRRPGPHRRRAAGRLRLRRRAGRGDGRLEHDRARTAPTTSSATAASCASRRSTSSPPSATSSATSSAPTPTWPS